MSCQYHVWEYGAMRPCEKPTEYRYGDPRLGTELCREHGEMVRSLGRRVWPVKDREEARG